MATMTFNDYAQKIHGMNNFLNILNSYGILYKKENSRYKAICPLHNEKTPSFFIFEEDNKAKFKCFGCGKSGDIIEFVQNKENISKYEALKKIYNKLGIKLDIKPNKLDKLENYIYEKKQKKGYRIESIYIYELEDHTPSFLKIKYRSLTDKSKKEMKTYKIIDKGSYFSLGTKSKDGEYTYTIYNYPKIKQAIDKEQYIYIVEGEKDVETLKKIGLSATTFYSKKWQDIYTKQLHDTKIVFIGDTGEAGEQFKEFVWKNLKDNIKAFKVVNLKGLEQLGDNKDVTDWLQAGHTKEELMIAIKNAWDWKVSKYWKDVSVSTKKDGTKMIKPLKTIDNLKLVLYRNKTKLYFNELTKNIEVDTNIFKNANLNTFATELLSQSIREGLSCTLKEVNDWINAIAYENSINPFKQYLNSLKDKWDKTSRLKEFCDCFKTVDFFNQDLKELLIRCWLLQFIDSAYNPEFKSQGLLVLKGSQGIGKTTSMSYLIPLKEKWVFLSEQKFKDDRDGIQSITSNQLVELSEFARSNKAVDALKGFVTSPVDRLHLKYDKHPTDFKRKTVFYATVNDAQFLIDEENRRFWIIDLKEIDLKKLEKFNFEQLWAELYYIYHIEGDKKSYLNKDEEKILEYSNQTYKVQDELTTEILNTFDFNDTKRIYLTSLEVTQFLSKRESATKITRRLNSLKINHKTIVNKSRKMPRGMYYEMPYPKYWHGKIETKYKNRLVNLALTGTESASNDFKKLECELKFYKEKCIEQERQIQELKDINQWYESQFKSKRVF